METEIPQFKCTIEAFGNKSATVIRKIGMGELRPAETVSGTVMMGVADEALYRSIFGEAGIIPLAVTTNLTINFFIIY
jgi:acyl-coenzyme A thioesterase PaaI-like protein